MELSKENATADDGGAYWGNDDEYFGYYEGPAIWKIVVIVVAVTFVLTSIVFILAMRVSKKFNRRVRQTQFFQPLAKSNNRMSVLMKKGMQIPDFDGAEYEEIVH